MRDAYMKRILLIVLICIVLLSILLSLLIRRQRWIGQRGTIKEIEINKSYSFEPFEYLQMTVLEINNEGQRCLFKLKHLKEGRILDKWIDVGEPISFTSYKDTNKKKPYFGVFLHKINKDTISIMLRWSDYGYEYCWRWK